ncbi:MAG: alpha/beta hydrolase fold domain-containing protein [Bacteroidota bacterium]
MKRLLLFILAYSLTHSLFAQDFSAFEKRTFLSSKEASLPYRILYPENYDQTKQYPLLLFLHGAGERGDDNEAQLVHGASLFLQQENRRKYPAIVVFPQCPKDGYWAKVERSEDRSTWEFPFYDRVNPALGAVIELIDQLLVEESIDQNRIYVSGLSMGGMGTFELLSRRPDLFAAAAPICGGGNLAMAARHARNTAFWIFHGDADAVVPVDLSRNMYKRLQTLGADVKYSEYAGVNHNSWDNAFAEPNYLKWLFSMRKKTGEHRYEQALFSDIAVQTNTYTEKEGISLQLDFYHAKDDPVTSKPLILYVHGGGFSGGSRDDKNTQQFAERLASMGYLVASMSYRLTMKGKSFSCDQAAKNKILTFQKSVEDIRDATNFLLEKSDELGIDKNKVVLAGSSAGAEAILHAAYWKDKHLLENSSSLPKDFKYAALVSMAGALLDQNLINKENAIPSLFYHGTCDPLVPYAAAPHHYCDYDEVGYMMLYGGASLAERSAVLGASFQLVTGENGGHEWAGTAVTDYYYTTQMARFIKHCVVEGQFLQSRLVVEQEKDCILED